MGWIHSSRRGWLAAIEKETIDECLAEEQTRENGLMGLWEGGRVVLHHGGGAPRPRPAPCLQACQSTNRAGLSVREAKEEKRGEGESRSPSQPGGI